MCHAQRSSQCIAAVSVRQQFDIGTDRFSHLSRNTGFTGDGIAAQSHLDRLMSALHHFGGRPRVFFFDFRLLNVVQRRNVYRDPVTEPSAEQLGDGQVDHFSSQVIERRFDGTHSQSVAEIRPPHFSPELVVIERITPNQSGSELTVDCSSGSGDG